VLTGSIVGAVASPTGLGATAVTAWNYGKWPVLILIALAIKTLL